LYVSRLKKASRIRNIVAFILIGIGFGIYCAQNERLDLILTAATFLISYIIAVCLHELGHACGAVLVGGEVHFIQLGQAYPKWEPWTFRFIGFPWKIYSAPLSGSVHASFYTTRLYRFRQCWMIACGPMTNLFLLLTTVAWLAFEDSSETPFYLTGWCLANGLLLLGTVPPFQWYHRPTRYNDGMLFLKTLKYSESEIQSYVNAALLRRELSLNSLEGMSLADLLSNSKRHPETVVFLWEITNRMHASSDLRYQDYVLKLVDHPKMQSKYLEIIIDTYLTWQLHQGPSSNPEVTDALSLRLLRENDCISTRGTRGSILIDQGRIEEGKTMLEKVLAQTDSMVDKVYSNVFLALAAKATGDLDLASNYALTARTLDSANPVIHRLSNLLVPLSRESESDPSTSSG